MFQQPRGSLEPEPPKHWAIKGLQVSFGILQIYPHIAFFKAPAPLEAPSRYLDPYGESLEAGLWNPKPIPEIGLTISDMATGTYCSNGTLTGPSGSAKP